MLSQTSDYFFSPFNLEGRFFWGDEPPFSPVQSPCGRIYQEKKGLNGHMLDAADFVSADKIKMDLEIDLLDFNKAPIWINKNPYNSVRIPWLKKNFPDCVIVAVIRKPQANVFSLLKKYIPHEKRGLGPENGWWGVKPDQWEKMLSRDKVVQSAKQWRAVNHQLIDHRHLIDLLVDYQAVCEKPGSLIEKILACYGIQEKINISAFPDMNDEYKTGSRLLSKNREYKNMGGDFNLSKVIDSDTEIKKLDRKDLFNIWRQCHGTWKRCLNLTSRL